MKIHQLKKYWEDNVERLYTYSASQVERIKSDNDTFLFFTTCGLPSDAAPFLSFSEIQENKFWTPNEVFKIDFIRLDEYQIFGSTSSGDPICVDTNKSNQIVYLNHDNDFERVFINNHIIQFTTCLTKYRDFILSLADKTNNDFIRRKFTNTEFEQLKNDFKNIDSSSLINNSFWTSEFENLLWERDNE